MDKRFRVRESFRERMLQNMKEWGVDADFKLTNNEAESIFKKALLGEHNYERELKKEDMYMFKNPIKKYTNKLSSFSDDELDNFHKFMITYFEKQDIVTIINDVINDTYSPGVVYNLMRVSNKAVENLIKKFSDYIESYYGVIINKKYIGDMKFIYPDIESNEDTGEITTSISDIDSEIGSIVRDIRTNFQSLYISEVSNGDVFLIASDNNDTIAEIIEKTNGLTIQVIPKNYFKWID